MTQSNSSDDLRIIPENIYDKYIMLKFKTDGLWNDELPSKLKKLYKCITNKPYPSYFVKTFDSFDDEISYLLGNIAEIDFDMYLNSAIEASKDQGTYIVNVLIMIYSLNNRQLPLKSIKYFDKESVAFIKESFKDAYERQVFNTGYVKVFESILSEEIVKNKDPLYSFYEKLMEEENTEYLLSMDDMEFFELFDLYKSNSEINYKEIIVSEGFQRFIKESDYTNSDFEDFDEIIEVYLEEESDLDEDKIFKHFVDLIVNDEKYISHKVSVDRIKNVTFGDSIPTIFKLLNK